jgi:hypothetical protein
MLTEDTVMEFPSDLPTIPTQLVGKQENMQFFWSFGGLLTHDEIRLVAVHQTTNPYVAILAKGSNRFPAIVATWLWGEHVFGREERWVCRCRGVAGGRWCIRRTSAYRPRPLGETALRRFMRL